MLNQLRSPETLRMASAILVVVVSAIVGHQAALGMEPSQWLGAAAAVLGSVALAALMHTAPANAEAKVKARRD
jgi:protein-S-isoprenylcysteine O-methyltransferase Ste14